MKNEAKVFKGTEVKELLAKAVSGIYFGRGFNEVMTDFASDFTVTDDGLVIKVDNFVTAKLPIAEDGNYVNYAVSAETEDEEWDGSTYFDYEFNIAGHKVCFNVIDKGNTLTWEQFAELTGSDKYARFSVESVDGGSVSVSMSDCIIDVETDALVSNEITIISDTTNVILDKSIIDEIYNDSASADVICYHLEFNNGMPDITVTVEYGNRLFK